MTLQIGQKHTKIVATVGPASATVERLCQLIAAGVNVFRINFSHGDTAERSVYLRNIRLAEEQVGRPVAVCADLCGPKIRIGMIPEGGVELQEGDEIAIVRHSVDGTKHEVSTTLPELLDMVRVDEAILVSDGRIRLRVERIESPDRMVCRVEVGGQLSSGKGVNLPETQLELSALTEKDRSDLEWIAAQDFDFVALSFVQRAEDINELRSLLRGFGSDAGIIAKVEKPQAIDEIDAIIEATDAVMVARGDLGVEMDFPQVPIVQKMIALKCQRVGKPCIIATEMLESMIHASRPTRAEVSDVANAVLDHADAVMLSAESAIGEYPVESVEAMSNTVRVAENFLGKELAPLPGPVGRSDTTAALAGTVRRIMRTIDIQLIATYTRSGRTARLVSKNRPPCPILSLSESLKDARRTCLYYGVFPEVVREPRDIESLLAEVRQTALRMGLAQPGDQAIVLTGHLVGHSGDQLGMLVQPIVEPESG